ncbi:hypothetical protein AAZX31_04G221900 [Glycine max]|uniref:Uncharacterized protein n=2 Tax=Glycine subgen. Soja TaxID=1462606 RepID=K7KM31_SOYBN|nr:hypothetical protein JHK87_011082 [Glycine soja]KAG5067468.1 hypothetical protein JHK86_011199 [Glycine max]KAH1112983.1 hypothetical protein GYH30_010945 [Glycine max]KRH64559.1 hypothetical protein GLYMA_04G241500v4 [Glycine max]RZC18135.1 hypothetical protein D0Y65_010676 [Glycine soja]
MACNLNTNQPPGHPPPPLEMQNFPPAPPPTPIIEEIRPTLDIADINFEEEFSFPVLAVIEEEDVPTAVVTEVKPLDAKNENPKEASPDVGGRKRKAN